MSLLNITTNGAIRTVTLNRPEKRNALNPEMMAELIEAFSATPPADERVTVIRAEGPAFCAGLQLSSDGLQEGAEEMVVTMFDTVQRYPLPVVAVVQGPAIAGGCELALHCDFSVALEHAPFAMPVAQIGVTTDWFLTKKIMESAGLPMARELLMLGDPIAARRLHDLGLISRAVPAADLNETAEILINRLAANAPLAMRAIKAQLLKQVSFYDAIDHTQEDALVAQVYAADDAVEGVAAKIEKRAPVFKGA